MKKAIAIAFAVIVAAVLFLPNSQEEQAPPKKIPGAFHALEMWNNARAYPNEFFPKQGFFDAFQEMKVEEVDSKITEGEWEAMGPNNTAGRVLDIAIDPNDGNNVWIGTASGGIWRTTTGGIGLDAWRYVKTGLPVLGVSSIAFEPNNSNVIYAGTGEVYNHGQVGNGSAYRETRGSYGIGIIKSNNGGTTWELALDWSADQGRGVNDIKVSIDNPQLVWAGTTEGVYRSNNGGTTWNLILDKKMITDLVVIPNSETVIAVAGNLANADQGIYRTINGGATWSRIETGVPSFYNGKGQLALSPSNPNVIYASIGENFWSDYPTNPGVTWLCRSTDAGATWSIANTVDYAMWQGWFSHDVVVDPNDENHIYVIGIDIWESTNGGASLIKKSEGGLTLGSPIPGAPDGDEFYSHSDHHDVKIDPNNPNRIFFANDGGVFFSNDGAETFRSVNDGLQTTQFYPGFSSSTLESDFAVGGLQDNSSVIYTGNKEWRRVVGGDGSWTAMSSDNPDLVYVSWQFLNIRRSSTKGIDTEESETDDWTIASPPSNGNALNSTAFIAPYVSCPSSSNTMYAGRDKIYKSFTGGNSWFAVNNDNVINGNPAFSMACSVQNTDRLYITTIPKDTRPTMHVTSDGGDSFSDITAGLPDRYLMDIAVDPFDDEVVYVSIGGFGTTHLYKSNNAGSDWIPVGDNLPDLPTNAVTVDPNNTEHVYVGNDIGVFFSQDGGESFVPWNEGLFTDAVLVMDLSVSPVNQKLRIASHGNGAFERDLVSKNLEVGIDDLFQEITVFPNPTTDKIFLNGLNQASTYTLHSVAGVLISKGTINPGESLDIKDVAPAQYLLRIVDESNNWQTVRIAKR